MTSYTLQVQPRRQYTIQYSNERGPQGATGATGLGFEPIPTARLLGNNTGSTALPTALQPNNVRNLLEIISQAETQAIVDGKLSLTGGTLTGKLAFSGATHSGLCLNSLTTAQYNALTAINGDLFRDSTTDRIDARLARGTVELLDTAGGQTINGALTASGTVTSLEHYFTNGANSTRVARATGATGRIQIYRPNDPATVSVEFGGGNDEIRIRGGLGSFNHTGAQLQISSSAAMSLGCTGALTLSSNGSTAQTITGANTVFGGTINYTNIDFPELVTNGGFDTDTAWSKGAGWTISGGTAVATGVVGFADIQQNLPGVDLGKTYIIRVTMVKSAGTGLQIYLGVSGSSFGLIGQMNLSGTYSFMFHKNDYDAAKTLLFRGASDFTGTIDNVSVKRAF